MFLTRLLSGIVILALVVTFGYVGGAPLLLLNAAIALIGLFELYRAVGVWKTGLGTVGMLGAAAYYVCIGLRAYLPLEIDLMGVVTITILAVLCLYVIRYPNDRIAQAAEVIFGFFYVPVFLSYFYLTREREGGLYLVWLIFLSSWAADTCAYCVGKLCGRHRMTPKLSPKKTVEGAIGGVAGAVLLTFVLYGLLFRARLGLDGAAVLAVTIAVGAGAVISMIGDLCASAIKREYEIKDFGRLIPGHGGIMDRFDSVIFTAPIVYYVLSLF